MKEKEESDLRNEFVERDVRKRNGEEV